MKRALLAAISAVVLGLASAPSLAQSPGDYSDAELRSVALAAAKVQRINDAYSQKLRAAGSQEEAQQVEDAAHKEMQRALDEEGLSLDRFRQIVMQAQSDRALADRIREQFRQTQ